MNRVDLQPWVRYREAHEHGRTWRYLVLSWPGGERPLTLRERIWFRLTARTPKP